MKRLLAAPAVIGGAVIAATVAAAPAVAHTSARTITVKPGHSIQRAVERAHPGDTIRLLAGTYSGGVFIHKNRITIRGAGARTVVRPGAKDHCPAAAGPSGFCVIGSIAHPGRHPVRGVTIESLTVRGFDTNGVVGYDTDRLRVTHVTASDNGEYGITEFHSTRGSFTHNRAIDNAVEAGLYVGDIRNAHGTVVADNQASGNALGVLVRHAHNVKVTGNELVGNCTAVALVDDGQPGGQGDTWVADNLMVANNKVCPPHEEVPPLGGTGVLLFGGRHNTITRNAILDNRGTQPSSGGVVLERGVPPMGKKVGRPGTGNRVTFNIIEHNKPFDVIDHSGGHNTIRHNLCRTSSPKGLCRR